MDAIKEAQEAALVVQENADVDRAIAESEHERDVIQVRGVHCACGGSNCRM